MSEPKPPAPTSTPTPGDTYKGWLFKWTNYIKGYQRRWFVLSNGLLSYYRTQAEMGHTCRGTINLATANIAVEDSCNFVISNGGAQTYHLKASSEVERQRWITALELAKAKAVHMQAESDDSSDDFPTAAPVSAQGGSSCISEVQSTLRTLSSKVEDLITCNDLIVKHGSALQRSLSELEGLRVGGDTGEKIRQVTERATLFRITSNAMINACRDFLSMAQSHSKRWQKALQMERDQKIRLEETLEQLAKQHNHLERAFRGATVLPRSFSNPTLADKGGALVKGDASDEDDDNEFFDAMEDPAEFITVPADPKFHRRSGSNVSGISTETGTDDQSFDDLSLASNTESPQPLELEPVRQRRTVIPDKPNYYLNLWSIMKNCIGKELSKIPMPVNFNEPLSMLQRLSEDLEYYELLDKAAKCHSSLEQMCYVAAFTVSSYSTTVHRTGKPFNPLLGETFELDRLKESGFRSLCEQVSHHPPAAAHHAFSEKGWTLRQEITLASKFRGKYLSIMPLGSIQCLFDKSNNHYSWKKVTTTVHNIIVGKLWIDQSGEIDVVNHKTGDRCHLKFTPYSYFSRDVPRKVTGVVTDKDGKAHYVLSGTWDERMEFSRIMQSSKGENGSEGRQRTVYQTLKAKEIWKKNPLPEAAENMYYFSSLALTLNEPEEGVALTDSRWRPDQRLMEEGRWEEANAEKQRLEEKQRSVRREREREAVKASSTPEEADAQEPGATASEVSDESKYQNQNDIFKSALCSILTRVVRKGCITNKTWVNSEVVLEMDFGRMQHTALLEMKQQKLCEFS
ncbi:transcript variant X2 [Nothobranchius furzeri]|uniref:Oxysterol-binding protein n=1 Tax=Nothobranchius furzeri TaxID=105023 RepID=A0A8C6LML3_NOTFU|nr:oxysterol-binding protein 1 isoform X1 [Nothobranchius furzeri]XP_015832850.1 oxysterol-binding protein 1 isoform X1 [Nothobranchius furzeri]XP_015832851.1 oxysterol-binding protein 1 isoform X1 [Nothobranchius furzeri]XP_054599797.1 oxysterol-binding protein 1 isoform X1 [Nothobranchius furzeri]XP_054599798.1 oxysterol-binding protein 1 isoform X1 [Nothobranchius furzeri]KAF7225426.1 transcript variant X3 [Nothobranchius furzeri]KAF7225427.1 transcript variant X1 [Nothobranchius furzeri]